MKQAIWIALAFVVVLVGGYYVFTRPAPVSDTDDTSPVATLYSCAAGMSVNAVYTDGAVLPPKTPGGPPTPTGSVRLILSDGRTLKLAQTISADGVRYANADESFVFWNKGNGALVLENNVQKSYIGCVAVAPADAGSKLTQVYSDSPGTFSVRTPRDFVSDASYKYQLNQKVTIAGTKFSIPTALASGTNLASDTYVSIETLPNVPTCSANLFLDGSGRAVDVTDTTTTYSVASTSGAGAGNRYEETVYALRGTAPCTAVRYFIHYSVFENYPAGSVVEFDKAALIKQFDDIRRTVVVNQ